MTIAEFAEPLYQLEIYLDGLLVYETDQIEKVKIYNNRQEMWFAPWRPAVAGIVDVKIKKLRNGQYFQEYSSHVDPDIEMTIITTLMVVYDD